MKANNPIIYAIAGSLFTLALVFAFKLIFLSDSLVPQTAVNTINYNDDVTENQQNNVATNTVQKSQEIVEPIENNIDENKCNEECVTAFVDKLILGKNLSDDDDGFSLSGPEARKIAERLQSDPSKLAELETTFSKLGDQSARDSIIYVFGKLPDDQIQELARRLSSSKNTRDRADSIALLQAVSSDNIDVQNEFKQIISTENDPDVLLTAIRASHFLDPDQVDSTTTARLSNLINSSENEDIRSEALVTKAKITKNDPTVETDIANALSNASTTRFTEAGLQAFDNMLNDAAESEEDSSYSIEDNEELQKSVERIANDPNVDPSTRVEALNLIRRHF